MICVNLTYNLNSYEFSKIFIVFKYNKCAVISTFLGTKFNIQVIQRKFHVILSCDISTNCQATL